MIDSIQKENAAGGDVKAQIFNRPVGIMLGLETNYHPFCTHPLYIDQIAKLPLEERVAEMRRAEVRQVLLTPAARNTHPLHASMRRFDRMYPMGNPANYEPDPSGNVASVARARDVSPDEVAYEMLLAKDGRAKLFVAGTGYGAGNLDEILDMLRLEDTVLALGDGGI